MSNYYPCCNRCTYLLIIKCYKVKLVYIYVTNLYKYYIVLNHDFKMKRKTYLNIMKNRHTTGTVGSF